MPPRSSSASGRAPPRRRAGPTPAPPAGSARQGHTIGTPSAHHRHTIGTPLAHHWHTIGTRMIATVPCIGARALARGEGCKHLLQLDLLHARLVRLVRLVRLQIENRHLDLGADQILGRLVLLLARLRHEVLGGRLVDGHLDLWQGVRVVRVGVELLDDGAHAVVEDPLGLLGEVVDAAHGARRHVHLCSVVRGTRMWVVADGTRRSRPELICWSSLGRAPRKAAHTSR